MPPLTENLGRTAFGALRQFVRKPTEKLEVCELCATRLAPEHSHMLELETQRIACACEACAILFVDNTRQRFRRIPREVRRLRDFVMDDQAWDSLLIPIKLAFFVHSSKAGHVVARYPSPAGAMESSLDLEYWNVIGEHNPVLREFVPDVEALLVNRVSDPRQYYRVPIDRCYRLVGMIRKHWHGLSGGSEVWKAVDEFFAQLNALAGEHHA